VVGIGPQNQNDNLLDGVRGLNTRLDSSAAESLEDEGLRPKPGAYGVPREILNIEGSAQVDERRKQSLSESNSVADTQYAEEERESVESNTGYTRSQALEQKPRNWFWFISKQR
jgi:hypothetical protein